VSSNEEPLVPIPMAVLVDEGDKRGAPSRTTECTVNYWPLDRSEVQILGDSVQSEYTWNRNLEFGGTWKLACL
jgi:hypothetical protein